MKTLTRTILWAILGTSHLVIPVFASLPSNVLKVIPRGYDIHSTTLNDAKKELEELVSQCGAGVVVGVKEENRCAFQVKLDDLFFEPLSKKTGLLQEKGWAYQNGVTFLQPKYGELRNTFDLRELMANGVPEIKRQKCGDCWAWATHHGLKIVRAVHDNGVFEHSVQAVLSCSHSGSCNGGFMSAVNFLKHGLPLEEEFPYAGSNVKCPYSSSDIQEGWDGKISDAPYIGSALQYSRGLRHTDRASWDGSKVENMMAAMIEWKSPLVVTVAGYSISGSGVYNACSAINSGGNHMVTIVGWDTWNDKRVAHVWNSWGPTHGENGVSRIQWECGKGRLNRGLGVLARIVQYKSPCVPPDAAQVYLHEALAGTPIEIGAKQGDNTSCSWTPVEGLADPKACVTTAKPTKTTEYHLTAQNSCGISSSMTLVHLWGRDQLIHTPFGDVAYEK